MEVKKISKIFLLSVVISMIVIAIINICERTFVIDTISAMIISVVIAFMTIICTLLLLNISWVSEWLDK